MFYLYRDESRDIPIWTLRYVRITFLAVAHASSFFFSFFFSAEKSHFLHLCLSFDLLVLVVPLKLIGVTQP